MSTVKTIICERCGEETPKRGNGIQKYCVDCSREADRERKRKWARNNPPSKDYTKKRRKVNKSNAIDKGIEINKKTRRNITWITEVEDGVDRILRVAVPFDYTMSKNSIWSNRKTGHIDNRQRKNTIKEYLVERINSSLNRSGNRFYEDKVWIDIFVQKPDHRGDAINVVDFVCDAVKEAIGVDDRWFSIRKLDWQITKENPSLYVGIGQSSNSDKRICSYCGRILSLDRFWADKGDRLGVGRECKDCTNRSR